MFCGLLTRQQLDLLRVALWNERRRFERLTEKDEEVDGWMASGGDAVATLVEHEVSAAVQTRVRARYQAIVDALHRLAEGTYGTCVDCSRPMPYGRLSAMPEASHCLDCAARA